MNKELIKKYKKEFDYWLDNPDNLLFYDEHHNGWHNLHYDYQWNCTVEEIEEFGKYGYVINDEYVEFRKALAEGKIIQTKLLSSEYPKAIGNAEKRTEWIDFDTKTNKFMGYQRHYRIKPEETIEVKEPDVKIGDFVIRKDFNETYKCINIKDDLVDLQAGTRQITIGIEHITHWQPQHGELCWFTNNKDENVAIIDKFHSYTINSKFLKFKSNNSSFLYCEPFLNLKPTWFKD